MEISLLLAEIPRVEEQITRWRNATHTMEGQTPVPFTPQDLNG
jgi:hypothetical protein